MPGLEGAPQRQADAPARYLAHHREAELKVRGEPVPVEGKARLLQLKDDIVKVHLDKGGQEKAVMQTGAPARQAGGDAAPVGLAPEPGQEGPQ